MASRRFDHQTDTYTVIMAAEGKKGALSSTGELNSSLWPEYSVVSSGTVFYAPKQPKILLAPSCFRVTKQAMRSKKFFTSLQKVTDGSGDSDRWEPSHTVMQDMHRKPVLSNAEINGRCEAEIRRDFSIKYVFLCEKDIYVNQSIFSSIVVGYSTLFSDTLAYFRR